MWLSLALTGHPRQ
ncbi:hypothetical protein YPPY96_3789, partial [Yersinia pestis PY-96]